MWRCAQPVCVCALARVHLPACGRKRVRAQARPSTRACGEACAPGACCVLGPGRVPARMPVPRRCEREKVCPVCACRRAWLREAGMRASCICVDRGRYVEVHVTCVCGCVHVHRCVDPGVWECLRVRSIDPAPLALAPLPRSRPRPPQSPQHVSAPQLHAPRCSVHQCVLDQEKTKLSGDPCPWSPRPRPLCCVTRMGGSSPAPSTIGRFPRSLWAQGSERGPRWGLPRAEPRLRTPPRPPRRARVGVAVMASVDIL